jgi:Family of unknown function (DUF5856)
MINGLIATVFAARNAAHIEHWNSTSYAEHTALGEFYDQVIDLIDSFVEAYQGKFGLIGTVKLVPSTQPLLEMLKEDVTWIEENHDKICKDNSALCNLLDTISELYLVTIYKLENLK